MTDKQIIEYKHIKCTKDDCCHYCGSVFCGYVDDIENLEKAYRAKEQECEELKTKLLNLLGKEGLRQSEKEFYEQQLDQLKAESENHLDDCFKISQKYSKSLQALKEIKVIANRLEQTKIPFAAIAEQIKDKIAEVEDADKT